MSEYHELIKSYLTDLEIEIVDEDVEEELVVVKDEENGINNLIIDCEHPIVILEQAIMPVPDSVPNDFYRRLLQINRTLVHGAFVLDEEAKTVIFRDTLQLDNLDLNELEGSIQALSLGLAEYGNELLTYVKN